MHDTKASVLEPGNVPPLVMSLLPTPTPTPTPIQGFSCPGNYSVDQAGFRLRGPSVFASQGL